MAEQITAKELEKQVVDLHSEIKKDIEKANEQSSQKFNDLVDKKLKEQIGEKLNTLEEANKKLQDHYDSLDVELQKYKDTGGSISEKFLGHQLGEKFKEIGNLKKAYTDGKLKRLEFDNLTGKAVGTMTTGDSLTNEVIPADYRPSIVEVARRKTRVRSLLPQGTTNSDKFRFIKEVVGEGSAGTTAEGAKKNQIDRDFSANDADVEKLSAFIDISEELLDDMAGLQSFLPRFLQEEIRDVEDTQLLTGNGTSPNLEGLNQNPTSFAAIAADSNAQRVDLFMQASAQLESLNYEANGILLHPQDWMLMYNEKDADGNYLRGLSFDTSANTLSLLGIPIFKSTAVTQGDYYIGDWANGAQIMDKMGLNVRFYDQNNDNAEKNIITVVAEERLAFPIYRPDSFIYGTIATDIALIKNFS